MACIAIAIQVIQVSVLLLILCSDPLPTLLCVTA